jgi:hypothetical protein
MKRKKKRRRVKEHTAEVAADRLPWSTREVKDGISSSVAKTLDTVEEYESQRPLLQ